MHSFLSFAHLWEVFIAEGFILFLQWVFQTCMKERHFSDRKVGKHKNFPFTKVVMPSMR